MRPQQQNRRMRGRNNNNNSNSNNNNNNNNNRKGPNPLTRNYESNGPDVKIRGSAQQVAEKYMQLARDAHSSGDRVMAENYLQHAEHYNRIIAAAQAQMPVQNRDMRDDQDEDDDGDNNSQHQSYEQPQQRQTNDGTGPQPEINGVPAEVALNPDASSAEQPREQRPMRDVTVQNGNGHVAAEGEEGAAPRRPRRPRRGRRPDGEFRNAQGEGEGGAEGSAESSDDQARESTPVTPEPDPVA